MLCAVRLSYRHTNSRSLSNSARAMSPVNLPPWFKSLASTVKEVDEREKSGFFSKFVEKIQDFLYT